MGKLVKQIANRFSRRRAPGTSFMSFIPERAMQFVGRASRENGRMPEQFRHPIYKNQL